MAKFQQTRPKKQGRNNRGRRKPEPVTVAAKPFDWRTFEPKDYVANPEAEDQGGLDLALRKVLKTAEWMNHDEPVLARHLRVLCLLTKSFADAPETRKSAAFINLVSCVLGLGDELARHIGAIDARLNDAGIIAEPELYGVSPLMAQLPAARHANRKRAKELRDNESNPRKS